MMKLDIRILSTFVLATFMVSAAAGQVLMENRELTVPQQCALLIVEEPVAKKLKLTPAQASTYDRAVKAYLQETKRLDAQKPPKPADRVACDKKFADACLGALNPVQKHRVLQLGVPSIGIMALTDPAISAQVGLAPVEVKKIKEICVGFAKRDEDLSAMIANEVAKVPEPKPGADRAEYEKKRLKVSKMYDGERQRLAREKVAAEKKVLAVMTSAQQAKWLDLAGPVSAK